jgi:hypothetical protein
MRSLHLLVEKTVLEWYRIEVDDDFDDDDQMLLQELFTEAEAMPQPYDSRDDDFHVTVLDDLDVELKRKKSDGDAT